LLAGLAGIGFARAEPPAAQDPDFKSVVAPLLARRCGACHGPATAESGWRIDDRERALAGGDSGLPGILAGRPEASEIVRRVTTDDAEARMPADADPLPAEERAILASWVSAGAPWPDDMATLPPSLFPDTRETSSHWAFQPIVRPPLPEIARVTHPIDAFVLQGLAAQGLSMQPEAAPPTLLRRVMFDLVGLPPTPADVQAFTADVAARGTDAAFGDLVDRLLADQWLTFLIAAAGIFLLLAVSFRSLLVATVALVPNALPIFVVLGLLGWAGERINMGTAMIAAVSMGLSVDSSIHYLAAFRRRLAAGQSIAAALETAHPTAGRAMIVSTLALVIGFLALTTSGFIPTVSFGALSCLTLTGGLLGNLVVLPVLLSLLGPWLLPGCRTATNTLHSSLPSTASRSRS
jgi:mono/diheme cytochrome c family protein